MVPDISVTHILNKELEYAIVIIKRHDEYLVLVVDGSCEAKTCEHLDRTY